MQQRHLWKSRRRPERSNRAYILPSLAFAAVLGTLGASADEGIWKTIFRGATEVNVVNVDVVVTDRDGQPVTDLSREDFELFDGKQPVEISNFYVVADGEAVPLVALGDAAGDASTDGEVKLAADPEVPEPPPMHLILYVDNVNLKPANRRRLFNRVREFLLSQRRLGAKVMLLSNERSLVVRQGFTSKPHEIFVALSELEETAAASPRFDNDRRDLLRAMERINVEAGSGLFATKDSAGQGLTPTSKANTEQRQLTNQIADQAELLLPQIQAYSKERLQHTLRTLKVLHQLVDTAAGLPGRKSVLYASDGLSLKPGEAIYEAYSRRFEALRDVGAKIHIQAEASRDDAAPQLEALIEHANASRVTFYTLDASPPERLSYGAAESDLGSGGNFSGWNDSLASTEEINEQQSLRLMAQATGGRFGSTPASWDAVLEGTVTDFANFYSLGFVADNDPDRHLRELKVKVRRKGLTVRHRSSFQDKPVTTRTAERTRAALLVDEMENPFDITLATEAPEPQDDGTFVVPLAVRIPLGKLVLLPGKTEHQGKVSMFVAVRDERGRTSDVNRHLCPIRIPNADVLTASGRQAACGVRLLMRQGPQRVAVSVLDELTAIDSTVHLALDVGSETQTADLALSQ